MTDTKLSEPTQETTTAEFDLEKAMLGLNLYKRLTLLLVNSCSQIFFSIRTTKGSLPLNELVGKYSSSEKAVSQ